MFARLPRSKLRGRRSLSVSKVRNYCELLLKNVSVYRLKLEEITRKNKGNLGIIDALEQCICDHITIGYMVSLRLISRMYVRDYS